MYFNMLAESMLYDIFANTNFMEFLFFSNWDEPSDDTSLHIDDTSLYIGENIFFPSINTIYQYLTFHCFGSV